MLVDETKPNLSHLSPLPRHHLVDGTIWVVLADTLLVPTGFIITIFLTRQLGPGDYGLFALAVAVIVWIEVGVTSVFNRATVKFVGQAEDWRPVGTTVVRLHLVIGTGAMFLLWLLAAPIAKLLNEPALAAYLPLFALDIPLYSLASAHLNILVGLGRFRKRALVSGAYWIARLLLIVLLVGLGLSVWGAILGSIGASLVKLTIGRLYIRPSLFHRSNFPIRQLWSYAVPLFLFALSLLLFGKLDLFALKALGGTATQAGIYGAAQNLARLPGLFTVSFSPLLLSTLSHTLRAEEGQSAQELGRNAMRVVIGLLPLAGMTAGAASEVVALIFGARYLPAASLLSLLIFGALALAMIRVAAAILIAADRPRWTFALVGPLLPVAVVGHLSLIPRLGAIGASLVTALVACLGAVAAILAVYRVWRILPPLGTLLRSSLVCALAYAVSALWPTPGFLLLLKLLAIILVIPLAFVLLGEFSKREITLARLLLRWQTVRGQDPAMDHGRSEAG
jgi:O-antigen/teichoic acid export membrane protein